MDTCGPQVAEIIHHHLFDDFVDRLTEKFDNK
jgi:hypothetical protein